MREIPRHEMVAVETFVSKRVKDQTTANTTADPAARCPFSVEPPEVALKRIPTVAMVRVPTS